MWQPHQEKTMEKMKMNKISTLVLALSLFASIAVFADDGNQTGGGNTNDCRDPNNCPPAVCTNGCPAPVANGDTNNDPAVIDEIENTAIVVATETVEYLLMG